MLVEHIPDEKKYLNQAGGKQELSVKASTGKFLPAHVFTTTLGINSLVYAEIFLDEK